MQLNRAMYYLDDSRLHRRSNVQLAQMTCFHLAFLMAQCVMAPASTHARSIYCIAEQWQYCAYTVVIQVMLPLYSLGS